MPWAWDGIMQALTITMLQHASRTAVQLLRPETFVVVILQTTSRRRTTDYGRRDMVAECIDTKHTFCDHANCGRERLWYSRESGTV